MSYTACWRGSASRKMTPNSSGWLVPPSTLFSGTFFAISLKSLPPYFSANIRNGDGKSWSEGGFQSCKVATSGRSHLPIGFEHHHSGRANVQLDARSNRPLEEHQPLHRTVDLSEALWQSIPPIEKLRFLRQSIRSLIPIRLP